MPGKVFIEKHLDHYLKSLVNGKLYIPGVIIGQVIGDNYYVVHLSAISICNEDININKTNVLAYGSLDLLISDSDTIFQSLLEVVSLLPGGSHVLGLFFIIPQNLNSIQPINIDFYEFNKQLNEHLLYKQNDNTWNYILLNYSTVNKKSFCYTVDFNRSNNNNKISFKLIDEVYGSFDNDWITLIGTFNFGALDQLNVAGGSKTLFSIRENLLDKFESILNESVYTFNGRVCDENTILREFEYHTIGNSLKNVVNIEFYKEVDLGNECKNASLKVERGKGKLLMSGLCSLAVPFNRNGTVKDAIKAIREDAIQTFAIRLKMHFESLIEEESIEEEDGNTNIVHETPRRILILKTEGSRFAFSDYVFPGESPEEALNVAKEILNLSEEKMELYDLLEKGRHPYYKTLSDIDNTPPQVASTITLTHNNNINNLIYLSCGIIILAIIVYIIKQNYE